MSYGTAIFNSLSTRGQYVDCILKGEKLADMPVQAPTNC